MWQLPDTTSKVKQKFTDNETLTFLGKDTSFKGEVTLFGTARVEGHFEGEIQVKGTLIVGESAIVKANVTTDILITSGKINGNVQASEQVQLLKSSVLVGELRSPAIMMEHGAQLHGMCDMGVNRFSWTEPEPANRDNVYDLSAHKYDSRTLKGTQPGR